MFPNTRSTPQTWTPTTQSRHNITSFPETIIEVPQTFLDIENTPGHFQHPPSDYPHYMNPAVNFDLPPPAQDSRMNVRSFDSRLTIYGTGIKSHWKRDLDGDLLYTMGQIQSLPSDASTADLDNLESVPLPPDTTPPPPPLARTAKLPSTSSSGGPSGRTSRMEILPRIPGSESSEENELLKEPIGTHQAQATQTPFSDTHIKRLRDLMSQPRSRESSPPSRISPGQPLFTSPLPTLSPELIVSPPFDMSNRPLRTFSPFQSNPPSGTPRGSSLNPQIHHGMPFEPQSTSSPPRSTSKSPLPTKETPPGTYDPRSNFISHPLTDAPPPRQPPVSSQGSSSNQFNTFPPSAIYPELSDQPPSAAQDNQVPVNLPLLHDQRSDRQNASMSGLQYRPTTSREQYSQEPPQTHQGPPPAQADSTPSPAPPLPQWPGYATPHPHPPFCPSGYVPYPVAEKVETGYGWDGYGWRHDETASASRDGTKGAGPQVSKDKVLKDHTLPPTAPSHGLLAPSQAQHGIPSSSSVVEDALESLQRRVDTLHRSVIHQHWTNLDSYFKTQTDPAFIAFVGAHTSINSRIRRLLDKLLEFLAGALASYKKMQVGSEHWHGTWRRQLSSLDRTMQAFCEFSSVVCNREPSFRILNKVLTKINQYEAKFRDLTQKTYTLLNRLRLRAAHSNLVKAHAEAQEQLRTARSKRDLPGWDEDKKRRTKLRGDFIFLQNRIALSRRPSWAGSRSSN